jgi:GH15 family glucan-1,4-alpha-glucosidase
MLRYVQLWPLEFHNCGLLTSICYQIFPAFDYARAKHTTRIEDIGSGSNKTQRVIFESDDLSLQLDVVHFVGEHCDYTPEVIFEKTVQAEGEHLGEGVIAHFCLQEGQSTTFILRDTPAEHENTQISLREVDHMQQETTAFWYNWISRCKYKGRHRRHVDRSLMLLKLLVFEPTGAVVAAPTFSLPEAIGGGRNWDYRYCWVRDSAFTIYILLRMGFIDEAEAYMNFISERFRNSRASNGALPIMFSIHGDTELPEIELDHLDGYRSSRPVRIGNGAAFHLQLDIYGELMDAIYLYNKYGKPVSWDQWVAVREIIDYVSGIWEEKGE